MTGQSYRFYRQDVIAERADGAMAVDTSYIDGDLPSTNDEITLVELDGTEREMEFVEWSLVIRPKPEPT
jgi:hypothetical protein